MNKEKGHIDEKLLLRFLLGEASKAETQQVLEWLQLSDENQKLLDSYEAVWAESGKLTPNPVAVDIPSAWNIMSERVDKYEDEKNKKSVSFKSRIVWLSSAIAAAAVILFAVYQLMVKPGIVPATMQFASIEEVMRDTLPDGTQVTLNAKSTITYPEKFAENERRIKLEGEAFFDVEPNKEKPFIIEAGNAFVQVLGTSFNVKAYENSHIEVIVTEGLVKLYTVDAATMDTSSVILKAGQKGLVSVLERTPVYVSENIPDELYWMDYTLIFNDTDLEKVFILLEEHYKVNIKVSDERIYKCRLSTTFTNNSITDILDVIVATFEFEYTLENNTYTITGDGCAEKNM